MTPEAKKALSSTIRGLRQRLLEDLHVATESAYRLSVLPRDAGLDEAARTKRKRLDHWLDEQVRAQVAGGRRRERVDFRQEAEQQAAYTLLNRLVILRLMEEPGPSDQPLRKPALIKGGWNSRAYQDFRDLARGVVRDDPTEGFGFLLQLVYEELAEDLPGLFGSAGIADLIPIPAATLRHAVEELNKEELETCWSDDMTLGWVYQYWNDLERERLDAKINDGGKIEPHEIASKTQMFTERYMVDWMLQNSLGLMWSTLCKKNGWIPEVQANGTLQHLEERRIEWRAKRAAGEVSLTALMPLENEEERRWAYFLPDQEIPDEAVELAPSSVREWKILDPAVGSGHFLVVALALLLALFQEEARHRGLQDAPEWSDRAIVEHLLAHTLHGIDIDPRAVQIAAASLWLKGKALCPEIEPEQLNLVAPNLRLADLPDDDPALVELRSDIEVETGIAGEFTSQILRALQGADHLGSLLKIDQAVDTAIEQQERRLKALSAKAQQVQPDLFGGAPLVQAEMDFSSAEARTDLQALLEEFLTRHSSANDLGLRLYGEQFSAGVRLVRMLKEASYHLLIANPPYLTAKHLELQDEFQDLYPEGKGNLYSCFLLRSLQLVKKAGLVSLLTMRGWMFLPTFAEVRSRLSQHNTLVSLMDLGWGAFSEVKDVKVSGLIAMSFEGHKNAQGHLSLAVKPAGDTHSGRTIQDLLAKQAGLLAAERVYTFNANDYSCINGSPLVYWWSNEFLNLYSSTPKISDETDVKQGMATADNRRFLRLPWEVQQGSYSFVRPPKEEARDPSKAWAPYIKGASGKCWIEPLSDLVKWSRNGLEIKLFSRSFVKNEAYFFRQGVSYSTIGNSFSSRVWRYRSIFDVSGSSIFPRDPYSACILMNSSICRDIAGDLNPTENFQVGDVLRVPLFSVEGQDEIFRQLESVFDAHEAARETSIEFRAPGPSRWRDTQDWAQRAVDRFKGDPLSALEASADPVSPSNYLSFALGICLGRFAHVDDDARPLTSNEAGILDPIRADLSHAIPNGILFLDGTLEDNDLRDGLGHTAAASLRDAWTRHGAQIASFESLREWLRCNFFRDVHKDMYDSRPIHWPLSSSGKTFVAWVNIHRMDERTLKVLLADHLIPARSRIDGELDDLRQVRDSEDRKAARAADTRISKLTRWRVELQDFISAVEQCADHGPPPTDGRCPAREQDAVYAPDLDDGVMINSAALWPLLEPQWKDPKKWWKELASTQGKKDYDWAHLAMRYWPTRVDEKCQRDPSLAVAHGCFWRYHPERAWAWELRLQQEIAPDFSIEEAPYRPGGKDIGDEGDAPHRLAWLSDHPVEALAAVEKEATRRMGRGDNRQVVNEMRILEAGLWSVIPEKVAAMEQRLSEKQGEVFSLRAPDEAEGRAANGEQTVQTGLALALEGAGG